MTIEYIRYRISEERREPFVAAYARAASYLAASPYCTGYELSQSEEEPENFILRITWTSASDHLEGFRKSPAFGAFLAEVKPYFGDISEMKHYTPTRVVSGG